MARRRPRPARAYRRQAPTRDAYDVVLIVCEGEKSEPEYLRGLRGACGLNPANIKIAAADGNDPVSIVKQGIETHRRMDGEFDRVFCVFDKDGHTNFQNALDLADKSPLGRKGVLAAIPSVPCFEIWVLLHFTYSTAPFMPAGVRSACDNVVAAIRAHMPEYEKNFEGVFARLWPLLDTAIRHGEQLASDNRGTGSNNPATEFHTLVKYLQSLRKDEGGH